MEDIVKLGTIEIEEIEIDIKIRIRKGKIVIADIDEELLKGLLEGITKRTLPEEYEKKALKSGTYTKEEIISLIKKYIKSAILHIERANEIIEILIENR